MAFVQMVGIVGLYALCIFALIDSLFNMHMTSLNGWLDDDTVTNRLVKIPIAHTPIALLLWLYLQFNKKEVELKIKMYENMPVERACKINRWFSAYICLSVLFFLFSVSLLAQVCSVGSERRVLVP